MEPLLWTARDSSAQPPESPLPMDVITPEQDSGRREVLSLALTVTFPGHQQLGAAWRPGHRVR